MKLYITERKVFTKHDLQVGLTEAEARNILNSPENLKHKAILWTIYSASLGIPELSNLRIRDIHPDKDCIFIKGAKGKKDRKTILSEHLLPLLRSYYKACKPSCWLFEGQTGDRYSATSIRAIFREAVKATNANPWATVHALRHSFATRCMQNNVNLRHVQAMPGHSSPKTTELYTKTIEKKKQQALWIKCLKMLNCIQNDTRLHACKYKRNKRDSEYMGVSGKVEHEQTTKDE